MHSTTQKQSIGIDISSKTFTACHCLFDFREGLRFSEVHSFSNDKHGFNQFMRWVSKETIKGIDITFLMEATGVYHQDLAYHLVKLKKRVVIALPNKTSNYFKSLNIKTKSDEIDAKVLSRFAVERDHQCWQAPSQHYKKLRELTRHHKQLQEQKTSIGNILHSNDAAYEIEKLVKDSNKAIVKVIESRIKACEKAIEALLTENQEIFEGYKRITTIKGIGMITAATILAETNGFDNIHSSKQLVGFAGLDVVRFESGTSVKRKTKISKKGNRYIRASLYFPAIAATRYNPILKSNYARILARNPIKMVGLVAIQRKLLVLAYAIWKNKTEFDPFYKKVAPVKTEATQDTTPLEIVP